MKHLNDMLAVKGVFQGSVQDKVNRPRLWHKIETMVKHLQWK